MSALLILGAIIATFFGAIFEGAEIGMYQLSRLRLRVGIERKKFLFILLEKSLGDRTSLLLSLLLGTNVSHFIATSLVTYVLLGMVLSERTAEILTTLIMVPVLFIFSELIPKSLFFYRSDTLMPAVSPILISARKIFTWCGLVPLMKLLSNIFANFTKLTTPGTAASITFQPPVKAVIQESQEEELFSPVQTDIINRLSKVSYLDVTSVMVAITKIQMVPVNSDRQTLLNKLKQSPHTRLPVFENNAENIIGYINIYECLNSSEDFSNLRNFLKPIQKIQANVSVIDAINIIRRENLKILLVTKSGLTGEKSIGILTMKDLIEELVGELAEW